MRLGYFILPLFVLGFGMAVVNKGDVNIQDIAQSMGRAADYALTTLINYLDHVDAGPANNMVQAIKEALLQGKSKLPELIRSVFH